MGVCPSLGWEGCLPPACAIGAEFLLSGLISVLAVWPFLPACAPPPRQAESWESNTPDTAQERTGNKDRNQPQSPGDTGWHRCPATVPFEGPETHTLLVAVQFLRSCITYSNVPSKGNPSGSYSYYKTICPPLPLLCHTKMGPMGFFFLFFYHLHIVGVSMIKTTFGIQRVLLTFSGKSQ